MTEKFMLPILDWQATKAEEVAVVQKLCEKYQDTHTYLESLFDAGLVRWFEYQVKMDLSGNLAAHLDYLDTEGQAEAAKAREQAKNLQRENDRLKAEVLELNRILAEGHAEATRRASLLASQLQWTERDLNRERARFHEIAGELYETRDHLNQARRMLSASLPEGIEEAQNQQACAD